MKTLATCISKGITPFGRRSIQPDGIDNMRSVSEKWDIASNLPHVRWLVNPIFFGPGPASAEHRGAPSTIQSRRSASARDASGRAVLKQGADSDSSGCNQVISGSCDSWPLATAVWTVGPAALPCAGGLPPQRPPDTTPSTKCRSCNPARPAARRPATQFPPKVWAPRPTGPRLHQYPVLGLQWINGLEGEARGPSLAVVAEAKGESE